MLVGMVPEVNTPIEPKPTPLPIQFVRALVEDRVAPRLGQDAFTVGVVLVDLMDRLFWRPVGLYMSQLCELCGFPPACPRRARAARAALIADGWLRCAIPKSGERTQAVYEMILKTSPVVSESNPGQNDLGKQLTPIHFDLGQIDPGQNDPSPRSKRPVTPVKTASDPGRFGTPSSPITLNTPNTPSNTKPPNPPEGEVFVLESSETGKQPPGKKLERKVGGVVSEIQSTEFPESLQSPKFTAAWDSWLKHRKELRKPMTPTSATKQLGRLADLGEERAIAAIDHSISNGWQGIFEPDAKRKKGDFFSGMREFIADHEAADLRVGRHSSLSGNNMGRNFWEGFGKSETAIEATATGGRSEPDFDQRAGDVWRPESGEP